MSGGVKRFFKSMVDAPSWMGAPELRQNASQIKRMAKSVFTVRAPTHQETFEQAVTRMGLTPDYLVARQRGFFRSACVYLLAALLVCCYAVYLLLIAAWMAVVLSMVVCLLLLALSFRDHFWYMQMKKAQLGCTFLDWCRFVSGSNVPTQHTDSSQASPPLQAKNMAKKEDE